MRVPSTSSSSLFPSWITKMTIGSLFISLFGIALFSVCLLGTQNVDVLFILESTQGLPNPFGLFQDMGKLYNWATGFLDKLDFNYSGEGIGVVVLTAVTAAARLLTKLVVIVLVVIASMIVAPLYILCWIMNVILFIFSVLNGVTPFYINLSFWTSILG